MRAVLLSVLILLFSGCAYLPTGLSQMQLTARDNGGIYYGSIRREGLALVSMTVEIDRRTYFGNLELTRPNETHGLYRRYGGRDAEPKTPDVLAHTNYTIAVLSSTDNKVLKCDFTDVGGKNAGGLCVDEAQRVYDVVIS